jgi:murein DD-endopeptidase MepM/ murein hydrolase activator NlpD
MTGAWRWLASAALISLPGSCIAADTQAPTNRAPATPSAAPPAALPVPPAPLSIGSFRLDRAPRQGGLALGWAPKGTVRLVKDGADVPIADDGRFLIAFGRDHAPVAILAAYQNGGKAVTERIAVARHAWKIENLPTLPRFSQPDAEFQARRPGEFAQMNAARRIPVQSEGWRQAFTWPARGRVSGVFGSQRIYRGEPGAPHSGLDIAGPAGAAVTAPADGVVILAAARPFTLEGNLLMINHGMGLNSAFLHLSRIDVKLGDRVRQGQQVGTIGMTGRATGPHLHWGMKWQDERVDPLPLVAR